MLPFLHRLPKQALSLVLRRGFHVRTEEVELVWCADKLRDSSTTLGMTKSRVPRFAFVVSTKIDKRAVKRNRIRRILSESVRLLLQVMDIDAVDGVFIVRKNIADWTQEEAEKIVKEVLLRARLIHTFP